MSELQNESVDSEEYIEETEIESQEIDAELAPDSDEEHEEQPQVDEEAKKQAAIQKVINEKTFKAKQAEREAKEYKARLEAYEAKEREQASKLYESIPEMPDPFDDDYDAKIKVRDEAILKKAKEMKSDDSEESDDEKEKMMKEKKQAKMKESWKTAKDQDLEVMEELVTELIDGTNANKEHLINRANKVADICATMGDKPLLYREVRNTRGLYGDKALIIKATPRGFRDGKLLGSGKNLGCKFSYEVQENPEGLAQAFIIGKKFI